MQIKKTLSFVFLLNIVDYLLGPVSISLFTKNLTVAEYGSLGFLSLCTSLAVTVFSLGLNLYTFKTIPGKPKEEQYMMLRSSLLIQIVASCIGCIPLFFLVRTEVLKFGIAGIYLFNLLIKIVNLELQRYVGLEKRIKLKSALAFIDARGAILLLLIIVSFYSLTITRYYYAAISVQFIVLVFSLSAVDRTLIFKPQFDFSFIKEALAYSLPLILINLGEYFLDLGDRLVIKYLLGDEAFGLYAFSYNWIRIFFKFGVLYLYIMQPYIAEEYNLNSAMTPRIKSFISKTIVYSFVLIGGCIVFFITNFEQTVLFLSKKEYLVTYPTVLVLSASPFFMFLVSMLHSVCVLVDKIKKVSALYVAATVFNIVLNFLVVPIMGITGAAMATLLTFFIIFIVISTFIKEEKIFDKNMVFQIFRVLLGIFLLGVFSYFFSQFDLNIILKAIVVLITGTLILLILRIVTLKEILSPGKI